MLEIDLDKVCFLIVKAREFDAKEAVVEPDPGSNPTDDGGRGILEDYADDPVYDELVSFISDLNVDEQAQLVALAWLGRGDYGASEYDAAVVTARQRRTGSTARYLLGMPTLADYLEDGLSQLDRSCEDFERDHL